MNSGLGHRFPWDAGRGIALLVSVLASGCGGEAALPGVGNHADGKPNANAGATMAPDETSTRAASTTTSVTTNGATMNSSEGAHDFLVPDGAGDVQVTQVYNGQTHQVGDARATLRAQSDEVEVYVDDVFWGGKVTGPQLNTFMHHLVDQGAAGSYRPDLGVLATNEAVFGPLRRENLPNGKQRVFVVDTSGAGDGYLCGWCDYPDLHLDGNLVTPLDGEIATSISAHELFHSIHRGYDADEEVWLDETLAEAAMSVNGLFTDAEWLANYLSNPNIAWGPQGADVASVHYGACLAFGSYLWEQGGVELMRTITAEPLNGWDGLQAALLQVGETRSAWDLFLETGAALYFDEPDRGLGFESFDLSRAVPFKALTSGGSQAFAVEPFGLVYVVLSAAGTLTLEAEEPTDVPAAFVADNPALSIQTLRANEPVDVSEGVLVVSAKAASTVRVSLD